MDVSKRVNEEGIISDRIAKDNKVTRLVNFKRHKKHNPEMIASMIARGYNVTKEQAEEVRQYDEDLYMDAKTLDNYRRTMNKELARAESLEEKIEIITMAGVRIFGSNKNDLSVRALAHKNMYRLILDDIIIEHNLDKSQILQNLS